jgi:TATA-box binding protein (TBP) (component of TFIID and TFIIIB)
MQLSDFVGKPCRSHMAFEFVPKKKTKIDLEKSVCALEKNFLIELQSKLLIILKADGKTISVFESGKILVRGGSIETKARKAANKIVKLLEEKN